MRFSDWEPIYEEILADFGFSRADDEMCVRILKAVTVNSDLIDDDELAERFGGEATVFGNAPCLEADIEEKGVRGTLVASGSAVKRLLAIGIVPDVVVTDLDGDMHSQLMASSMGAVTALHAHGDNQDLVRDHAGDFRGPVILTTQSAPERTVYDFGGFTDGDRAYCMARHFGCRTVIRGFDYDNPLPKDGTDPQVKLHKLKWARHIIEDLSV